MPAISPPFESVKPARGDTVPADAPKATGKPTTGFPVGSSATAFNIQGPAAAPEAAGVANKEREATKTTDSGTFPEVPPPAAELETDICKVPGAAKREPGTEARS